MWSEALRSWKIGNYFCCNLILVPRMGHGMDTTVVWKDNFETSQETEYSIITSRQYE